MLDPLRPSSEDILIVRAPGVKNRCGCHSIAPNVLQKTPSSFLYAARYPSANASFLLPNHPSCRRGGGAEDESSESGGGSTKSFVLPWVNYSTD